MPATLAGAPFNEFGATDKIRNYSTTIKVVIHSHQTSTPIVLTQDVRTFSSSKTIKGTGKATVTLTPSKNYLNQVFPNDYINIYISRGDSNGWVRVFFGFIDRISESTKVNNKGVPQSEYVVSCSDFAKAFDRTQIYFNPSIMGRDDFKSSFGGVNIGGLALFTKGIKAQGSPPDVILQVLFSLMGFGSQFVLPASLNPNSKDKLRQERARFILGNAGIDSTATTGDAFLASLDVAKKKNLTSSIIADASDEELALLAQSEGLTSITLGKNDPVSRAKLEEAIADRWIVNKIFKGNEDIKRQVVNAISTTSSEVPSSLLDIVDVFTFVEREAIDGYMAGTSVWTQQGSLANFIQSYSNELVNELFWDLRAVNTGDTLASDNFFEREPDEVEGNIDGELNTGVKYVPALVMREYPFSTIGSFDASLAYLGLVGNEKLGNQGVLQFGNIFNDGPNVPGRHVIDVKNINLADLAVDTGSAEQGSLPSGQPKQNKLAKKHIDVAVISEQEIISMDVGRSDADHYNLFEIGSDALVGRDIRFITKDYQPIITPIDIEQHGLRVRSVETRFDRFTPNASPSKASKPAATPPDSPEQNQVSEESAPASPVYPIQESLVTDVSPYGYRIRNAGDPNWTFHYGYDFYAPAGTPVRAIASGTVVASAPPGPFSGYGEVVAIKHKDDGKVSFYAHLNGRADKIKALNPDKRRRRNGTSKNWFVSGKMREIEVSAGDVIGFVGSSTNPGKFFTNSSPHLHLEILTGYPASGQDFPEDTPASQTRPSTPSSTVSEDPLAYLEQLVGGYTGPSSEAANNDESDGGTVVGPSRPKSSETEADRINAATLNNGPPAPTVDNKAIRYQLLRWVLLQDHWYQHNKEYLSGNITLRGAPDIRVGYRLDIVERDLSFYVEAVTHSWKYPGQLVTTLAVTRGQPNNPYPAYVAPAYANLGGTENQRRNRSRLSTYFITPDPIAVRRSFAIRSGINANNNKYDASVGSYLGGAVGGEFTNPLDTPDYSNEVFEEGLQYAGSDVVTTTDLAEDIAQARADEAATELQNTTASVLANLDLDPVDFDAL